MGRGIRAGGAARTCHRSAAARSGALAVVARRRAAPAACPKVPVRLGGGDRSSTRALAVLRAGRALERNGAIRVVDANGRATDSVLVDPLWRWDDRAGRLAAAASPAHPPS